jgi:hypothetical protein
VVNVQLCGSEVLSLFRKFRLKADRSESVYSVMDAVHKSETDDDDVRITEGRGKWETRSVRLGKAGISLCPVKQTQ